MWVLSPPSFLPQSLQPQVSTSALTAAPHKVPCALLKIHPADIKEISIISTQPMDGAVPFMGELRRLSLQCQTNLSFWG